nr:unnamed protein product [Callosobruchus analis]
MHLHIPAELQKIS